MNTIGAVLRFELARTMTLPRLGLWLGFVLFPSLIVGVIRYNSPAGFSTDRIAVGILFGLIPEMVCLLGMLLWVTPAIQSELENKTWIYVAVRPWGKRSLVIGKYLTALVWTLLAAWCALIPAVYLARPDELLRTGLVLGGLSVASTLAYGAVYSLIAVLIPKRAMVLAVAYTLILEFIVGLIPALVNQLTVQYRLRGLLVAGMGWEEVTSSELAVFLGAEPAWRHLLALTIYTAVMLGLTLLVLGRRQFVSSDEG